VSGRSRGDRRRCARCRRGEGGRVRRPLVGYSDRWQRNLRRTLELLEDELHPPASRSCSPTVRILSSDPEDWDELVAEAAAAERYIRRLAGRISDGLEAKWRHHADQAGNPPLGFRRRTEIPHVLEVDPGADRGAGRRLRLEERTIAAVRRILAAPAPIPMATSSARYHRREMRELAERHLAERIGDAPYLEQLAELRRRGGRRGERGAPPSIPTRRSRTSRISAPCGPRRRWRSRPSSSARSMPGSRSPARASWPSRSRPRRGARAAYALPESSGW
jgi:hypothetical protein